MFEENTPLNDLLQTMERQDSDVAQIMMSIGYDITTGVYDHNQNPGEPMAVEAAHPSESYFKESGIYKAMERYERQKIKDVYNLSLIEYLSLPREYIDMMTNQLMEIASRKKAAAEAAANAAEEEASKSG